MKRFRLAASPPATAPKAGLTPNQMQAIRLSGQSASTLAAKYNVSDQVIRGIQSLKSNAL